MNDIPMWLAIVTTIGGILGGTFGGWLLNIYQTRNKSILDLNKQSSDIRISENEQAFKIYKDLLDNLRIDVQKMTNDMNRLEEEHLKCREENAALKAEVRNNTREIEQLQQRLKPVIQGLVN